MSETVVSTVQNSHSAEHYLKDTEFSDTASIMFHSHNQMNIQTSCLRQLVWTTNKFK